MLDNRGAANFNRSTILNKASATHLNSGAFNITTPSITVTFSGSATTFTNQVPGTITDIGTLNVSAITFTNDGTMSPGLSFGILTLNGDFTQSSSGSLNTEIGGRDPGADFDLFNVTGADGAAALDGNLNVLLDPGFEPCVGDRSLVMPYLSHTGQFATVNGAAIDATTFFSPIYEADGVTLEVKSSVPSVPQICIVSPADGSIFNSGTTVLLQGIASDPEDGDISSSIVWTSNLQAGAGIGAELSTSQLIERKRHGHGVRHLPHDLHHQPPRWHCIRPRLVCSLRGHGQRSRIRGHPRTNRLEFQSTGWVRDWR